MGGQGGGVPALHAHPRDRLRGQGRVEHHRPLSWQSPEQPGLGSARRRAARLWPLRLALARGPAWSRNLHTDDSVTGGRVTCHATRRGFICWKRTLMTVFFGKCTPFPEGERA